MTMTTEPTVTVTPAPTDELIPGIQELVTMLIFKLAANHNETLVSDEC